MTEDNLSTPGLKWIKRRHGTKPYWVAPPADVKEGFRPKTVPLSMYAHDPAMLAAKCQMMQSEVVLWRGGLKKIERPYDGSIKYLVRKYMEDEGSPYHQLKPSSYRLYSGYLPKIEYEIGEKKVDTTTGADLREFHRIWSKGGEHLAAASAQIAILKAVISYGVTCRLPGCSEFAEVLRETSRKLPHPSRREAVATYDQVVAAREAAHAAGRPSWALAYALVYETTLRLWDVIGQWIPLDAPGVSAVINEKRKEKWVGLRWEEIGDDLVLRYTPSKTERKTGKKIVYPLTMAPMVMEEIQYSGDRTGPLIIDPDTGQPPRVDKFQRGWRSDRAAAGLPGTLWARDLRASGITEARAADVSLDDAASVAGHAGTRTTSKVYDRAALEAAERFAKARLEGRQNKK